MRTRVVRYWVETEWLHKVEAWRESDGKEVWIMIGGKAFQDLGPIVKAGEWYWQQVAACLSHETALSVAKSLSDGAAYDTAEVVAEFQNGMQFTTPK